MNEILVSEFVQLCTVRIASKKLKLTSTKNPSPKEAPLEKVFKLRTSLFADVVATVSLTMKTSIMKAP